MEHAHLNSSLECGCLVSARLRAQVALLDQNAVPFVERRFKERLDLTYQGRCGRRGYKVLVRRRVLPDLDQYIEIRPINLRVGAEAHHPRRGTAQRRQLPEELRPMRPEVWLEFDINHDVLLLVSSGRLWNRKR